ncbi:MAG TPA: 2-oxo acid dehydrogenase subunit E2 [Actinomycetota bacterium]|nr:2-oxo acid dehydrogenase subunit E2 [Actinomycetota bacterium]
MPWTTPLTRRLARDLGVDLERVRGTGRGGRITRADVEAAAAAPVQAAHPPVHLTVAVDAEALLDVQDGLGGEVSVPELVARACAMLRQTDPALDSAFGGDALAVTHLDVDQLRPPIDPPATAVLALGAVLAEVVAAGDGIEVRRRMRLTLSIDDRAVDGATGARFLGRLKTALEQPLQSFA